MSAWWNDPRWGQRAARYAAKRPGSTLPEPTLPRLDLSQLEPLLLRFELSAPEAVERFRDEACKLLEKEGELSSGVQIQLGELARAFRVHPRHAAAVQDDIITLPSVQAALAAARERTLDGLQLAEAIRTTRPGGVVLLNRGRYVITRPLVLRTPIRLVGEGCSRTFFVGETDDCVMRIEAGGDVQVEGVAFEYRGRGPGDAVVVESGDVELRACRFAWAASDPLGERGGRGLLVRSAGRVTVAECVAERNARAGIYVEGTARPRLEKNQAILNDGSGLVFTGRAEGTATENTCAENREHGIAVRLKAAPSLEGNTCRKNSKHGIDYADQAQGSASARNRCEGNHQHGIYVSGTATPRLEDNICAGNEGAGIALFGRARVEARGNLWCDRNLYGILVDRDAEAVLEGNHCAHNQCAGIAYHGSATGTARKNYTTGGRDGIEVQGTAQPLLEENLCENNTSAGIWFGPGARGRAFRNQCHRNSYGIYREQPIHSRIDGNSCDGNTKAYGSDR